MLSKPSARRDRLWKIFGVHPFGESATRSSFSRAAELSRDRDYSGAIRELWKAVLNPELTVDAFIAIAESHRHLGEFERARHILLEAMVAPEARGRKLASVYLALAAIEQAHGADGTVWTKRAEEMKRPRPRKTESPRPEAGEEAAPVTKSGLDESILWRRRIYGTFHAPPQRMFPIPTVAGDDLILSLGKPAQLHCVRKQDGATRWRVERTGFGGSAPAFNDLIYWQTTDSLHAVKQSDGRIQWSFCPFGTAHEWIYSTPVIHEGRVFVGDRTGRISCLDSASGKLIWDDQTSSEKNKDVNSTPLISRDLLIVPTNASIVIAYEWRTGRRAWETKIDGPCIDTTREFDGGALLETQSTIYLLDPVSGAIRREWRWPDLQATATVCGDRLLVRAARGGYGPRAAARLISLDSTRTFFDIPVSALDVRSTSFKACAGIAYEARFRGLSLRDPKDGLVLHRLDSRRESYGCPPAIDGDVIYALSERPVMLSAFLHPTLRG